METKQVIIQNEAEEKQFLEEVTKCGWKWINGVMPIEQPPSQFTYFTGFPYIINMEDFDIAYEEFIPRLTLQQFLESK